MSVESAVLSASPALSLAKLVEVGRGSGLCLRAVEPSDSALRVPEGADSPLPETDLILLGWPAEDDATTRAVDEALRTGDRPAVDRLGREGKVGWCDFSCRRFDYERSWDKFPEERDEFEESLSPEELERMRGASTRYFFRSGTRPAQNGRLLGRVADLIASASGGFLEVL